MRRLAVILLLLWPILLRAKPEHAGFRFEIMNRRLVNLYGWGTYTHKPYMDAEMLFYFNFRSLDLFYLPEHPDYMAHFATFAVKVRPLGFFPGLQEFRLQPYAGGGYFPFVLRGFLGHITLGVEFLQTETFAFDMNLKRVYAIEDGLFRWLPEGWLLCLGVRF